MDYAQLTESLTTLGLFEDASDARLALFSSLETLSFLLPDHLLRALKAGLPAECGAAIDAGQAMSRRGAPAQQGLTWSPNAGQSVERTQEVCSVLGRMLPAELVRDLMRELPTPLAAAFEGSAAHRAPPAEHVARAGREGARHLSEAKLGSAHSLASGRPPEAQQNSVAAPNPHGDTKLSSAHGLTQEREGESLAEAVSPADRERGA